MLTLSLYFFNLLPLPFLDGGQLLDALQDWWLETPIPYGDDIDIDAGDGEELAELGVGGGTTQRAHVPARRADAKKTRLRLRLRRGLLVELCVRVAVGPGRFDDLVCVGRTR